MKKLVFLLFLLAVVLNEIKSQDTVGSPQCFEVDNMSIRHAPDDSSPNRIIFSFDVISPGRGASGNAIVKIGGQEVESTFVGGSQTITAVLYPTSSLAMHQNEDGTYRYLIECGVIDPDCNSNSFDGCETDVDGEDDTPGGLDGGS